MGSVFGMIAAGGIVGIFLVKTKDGGPNLNLPSFKTHTTPDWFSNLGTKGGKQREVSIQHTYRIGDGAHPMTAQGNTTDSSYVPATSSSPSPSPAITECGGLSDIYDSAEADLADVRKNSAVKVEGKETWKYFVCILIIIIKAFETTCHMSHVLLLHSQKVHFASQVGKMSSRTTGIRTRDLLLTG